ncbi:hypothetical protein ACFLTH_04835 [Bacteroidota bacterium]
MKKTLIPLVMALWIGMTSPANAQENSESKVNVSVDAKIASNYVYRGFKLSEGVVVQPSATLNRGNFSVTGVANYDFEQGEVNEITGMMDYTVPVGGDALSLGYRYISFPNTKLPKTQEIYANLKLVNLLNPSLEVVHDFDEGNGQYISLSVKANTDFVDLTSTLGYNNHFSRNKSGFSQVDFGASKKTSIGGEWTLTTSVNYSRSLSNDFPSTLYCSGLVTWK